ncbi:MAG: phytanoyl-CoA dioxygenase family protein [Planctomycetota bacterium]|nr:phytanoyl-CoA dioxygenase family protein [Planctomycetota bacterium]
MAFEFRDEWIHSYRVDGYVILPQVLPPALIRDLRRATVRSHELARQQGGPQAQRLQPVVGQFSEAELKPFQDYLTLAPLVEAIRRILSPRHTLGNGNCDRLGLLLEPAAHPWCTPWHRDMRETTAGAYSGRTTVPDLEEFRRVRHDPLMFNQVNCPLYEDNCTWYVPGSYLRSDDLPAEAGTLASYPRLDDATPDEQREAACLAYCRGMPRAVRASMNAGDFMLYHPLGLHLGNYLPDRRRVTLHDYAPCPEQVDWISRWEKARNGQGPPAFSIEPPDMWHSPLVTSWRISRLMPKSGDVGSAAAVGLGDALDWTPIEADKTGPGQSMVNVHRVTGDADGIAYVGGRFRVDRPGVWDLLVGHDGGCRLFVDGKSVLCEPVRKNPARPDRSLATVRLEAGEHEIVCALDTDKGNGWGLYFRFRVHPESRADRWPFPVAVG